MSLKRGHDPSAVTSPLLPSAAVVLALSLMACGPDPLEGRVVLSGSSTLAPLATAAVDQWKQLHPRVETRVEAIGSDAGLERLVRYGDADFALVSRPVTDGDRAAARVAGKELVVFPLAWDAVCLVVPVTNTWAASLSRDQAARAFTSAQLWSDLDPSWPQQPIHRFALGPNSGTADVLAAAVLGGQKASLFTARAVQASEDDQILARGVSEVEGALGYLGWTTARTADKALRVVALDGVSPTEATIRSHRYGLPRQLWLVGTRQGLKASPEARSLLRFLFEQAPVLTQANGLVPLSDTERALARTVLQEF